MSTLDSCSVFIPRNAGLRFDTDNFGGFHCCIEDLCLAAHAKGLRVLIPPGQGDHLGTLWMKPDWMADHSAAREKLVEKWSGVEFQTT